MKKLYIALMATVMGVASATANNAHTVFLKNDSGNWGTAYAHVWGGTSGSNANGVGYATKRFGDTQFFVYSSEKTFDNVIFTPGTNWDKQTANIEKVNDLAGYWAEESNGKSGSMGTTFYPCFYGNWTGTGAKSEAKLTYVSGTTYKTPDFVLSNGTDVSFSFRIVDNKNTVAELATSGDLTANGATSGTVKYNNNGKSVKLPKGSSYYLTIDFSTLEVGLVASTNFVINGTTAPQLSGYYCSIPTVNGQWGKAAFTKVNDSEYYYDFVAENETVYYGLIDSNGNNFIMDSNMEPNQQNRSFKYTSNAIGSGTESQLNHLTKDATYRLTLKNDGVSTYLSLALVSAPTFSFAGSNVVKLNGAFAGDWTVRDFDKVDANTYTYEFTADGGMLYFRLIDTEGKSFLPTSFNIPEGATTATQTVMTRSDSGECLLGGLIAGKNYTMTVSKEGDGAKIVVEKLADLVYEFSFTGDKDMLIVGANCGTNNTANTWAQKAMKKVEGEDAYTCDFVAIAGTVYYGIVDTEGHNFLPANMTIADGATSAETTVFTNVPNLPQSANEATIGGLIVGKSYTIKVSKTTEGQKIEINQIPDLVYDFSFNGANNILIYGAFCGTTVDNNETWGDRPFTKVSATEYTYSFEAGYDIVYYGIVDTEGHSFLPGVSAGDGQPIKITVTDGQATTTEFKYVANTPGSGNEAWIELTAGKYYTITLTNVNGTPRLTVLEEEPSEPWVPGPEDQPITDLVFSVPDKPMNSYEISDFKLEGKVLTGVGYHVQDAEVGGKNFWVKYESKDRYYNEDGTPTDRNFLSDNPLHESEQGKAYNWTKIDENNTTTHDCRNFSPAYYRLYMQHTEKPESLGTWNTRSTRNIKNPHFTVDVKNSAKVRVARTYPMPDNTTGIEDVIIDGGESVEDANAPVIWYNLQGMRVENPSNGIYIRVQGKTTTKVYIK